MVASCTRARVTHARQESSSRHRVIISQVVRWSAGVSSSKPSWLPAPGQGEAAAKFITALAATVIALIFTTVMCSMMAALSGRG